MLALIANLWIRSALILGAALLLWRVFSRSRPGQRYAVLFSAFVLLLAWPLLALLIPAVDMSFGREPLLKGTVTIEHLAATARYVAPTMQSSHWPISLWMGAAILSLFPLLLAHLRLLPIARRAAPVEDPEWLVLLHSLCTQLQLGEVPLLLIHPGRLMPMTFGLLRSRIVLPAECRAWTAGRRRIVLLHELAHIKRRDLAAQCLARAIAALWCFQPLCWIALPFLRRESEHACDALVLASGVRPSEYAAELLAIARSFVTNRNLSAAAIAMAHETDLADRVRTIVEAPTRCPRRVGFFAISSLTALTVTVSAVGFPPQSKPHLRGHFMKHSLLAGLVASAGLSAATIGGSLYDPSGALVPNAKALLYDPDTNNKFETTTSAEGKFQFETLPAGQYILRVQKPGFATLFREFNVKSEAKVEKGFTLALGSMNEQLTVAAPGMATEQPSPQTGQPVRIGGEVAHSNLIHKIQPVYPAAAKAAGVQGTVSFEMVISKEGEPLDIQVVSSPDDSLTQSALEAVRQWRYRPTLLNGNPVEIVTNVIVNYTLSR